MKSTGITWRTSIQSFILMAVFGLLFFASCEEPCKEEVKGRCDKTCDRIGLCEIKSSYNSIGEFVKSTRVCRWVAKPDPSACSECTNEIRNEKGKVTSKTCTVCNLCEKEFDCLEDSECKEPSPICDRGLCVGCLSKKDCTAESRPLCVDGQCVGCIKDTDCKEASKPQCYKSECVSCRCATTNPKAPQCLKNADGTVKCVECSEDQHCAGTKKPTCDKKKNVCVAECQENQDCKGNLKCFNGSCLECAIDKDCTDPQAPVCNKGKCGCESNKDCASSTYPTCSPTKNRCVECSSSGDCDKSFPICNALGRCEQQECEPGKTTCAVSGQACRKLGRRFICAECIETQDCTGGKSCDLSCFCCK